MKLELVAGLQQLQITASEAQQQQLLYYIDAVMKWRKMINITGFKTKQEVLCQLIFDSLAVLSYLSGDYLLDIGTGAGVPGLPLAIMQPKKNWTLCDSNNKKMSFLRMVCHELGLANVSVAEMRIEQLNNTMPLNTIICRAFSSMKNVIEMTQHLTLSNDTVWLFLKGQHYQEEIANLPPGFRVEQAQQLTVPGVDRSRYLVTIKRG